MLWNVYKNEKVAHIPHEEDYKLWTSCLSLKQIQDIKAEILKRIGKQDVVSAGWLPGEDWSGTPFQAISEACKHNRDAAGKCFGLFVWVTLMEAMKVYWGFENVAGQHGMRYFKVHPKKGK